MVPSGPGERPEMVGRAVVAPLEHLRTRTCAHVGDAEQQAAVDAANLVVAGAVRDRGPEVVGGTRVAPDERGRSLTCRGVLDAEDQVAQLVDNLVLPVARVDEGPDLRGAAARRRLHHRGAPGGTGVERVEP